MLIRKSLFSPLLWCIINYALLVESKKVKYMCKPHVVDIKTQNPITNLANECPNCIPKCCSQNDTLIIRKGKEYPRCVNLNTLGINLDHNIYDKYIQIYKSYNGLELEVNQNKKNKFFSEKNFTDFPLMHNKMFEDEACYTKVGSKPFKVKVETYILEVSTIYIYTYLTYNTLYRYVANYIYDLILPYVIYLRLNF